MPEKHRLTIGIFGHYGNENMGDEAIVAAVAEEIRARYPDARILGFSIVPQDTAARHGIESFPIRRRTHSADPKVVSQGAWLNSETTAQPAGIRSTLKRLPVIYPLLRACKSALRTAATVFAEIGFLFKSYKVLRSVDLLMVSGSGQLTDQDGAWGFPYTLYKWSVLCAWADCRLAFVGVGAGPLTTERGKWFDKQALLRAGYRSYRDVSSYRLINQLGIGENDLVCPDLAFGKRTAPPRPVPSDPNRVVVGINPMAYHDPRYWPFAKKDIFDRYIAGLTQIIVGIASRGDSVVLFPTQLRADILVIQELIPVLDRACPSDVRARITVVEIDGLEAQLAAMAKFDVIIATRFHGVLMSYLVGKPTIGISYHPKIADLVAYMGHPECALPIDPLDVEAVLKVYDDLRGRLKQSHELVLERLAEQRAALAKMYDQLFETLLSK